MFLHESYKKSFFSKLITYSYIYNWSLQTFSHNYNLVKQVTYVVCLLILYMSGHISGLGCVPRTHVYQLDHDKFNLQFKIESEQQILVELFMVVLFTPGVFARNVRRRSRLRNISSFWFQTYDLNRGLTSNKSTLYLLDYGDYL